MKIYIAFLVFVLILAVFCLTRIDIKPSQQPINSGRIKLKADITINEHGYKIIEVDSSEYLVTGSGVCPLVK